MAKVFPIKTLRPKPEIAEHVASVPYDVVDRTEARALADGNPHSFLHVTKPEIDLDDRIDDHSEEVYARGPKELQRLLSEGTLVEDQQERFYAYRLIMDGLPQTGIVLGASVADYDANLVRKHEFTRPDKEDDRVKHMEALNAQSGTVLLCHNDHNELDAVVKRACSTEPLFGFKADDGVEHTLWEIPQSDNATVQAAFEGLGAIYIADGHHRSAAASRVAKARRNGSVDTTKPFEKFLAVSFPASEMRILPYNRVVHDLNGHSTADIFAQLEEKFSISPGKQSPIRPNHFNMFLDGKWHTLAAKEGAFDADDPVLSLDVSILQTLVLEPLFGITDPRRDKRISFVGGIRGDAELEKRAATGGIAFALHATPIEELFAVAEAGQVMPPKSTWFEPKLRDGMVVHPL